MTTTTSVGSGCAGRRRTRCSPRPVAVALAEMAVELSLKLGEALELMAGDEGFAAVDLAEVWFVD